jgi:hypothetical protein
MICCAFIILSPFTTVIRIKVDNMGQVKMISFSCTNTIVYKLAYQFNICMLSFNRAFWYFRVPHVNLAYCPVCCWVSRLSYLPKLSMWTVQLENLSYPDVYGMTWRRPESSWSEKMASDALYERVIQLISKPPSLRPQFEVIQIIGWFRKKTDLFRELKTGKHS